MGIGLLIFAAVKVTHAIRMTPPPAQTILDTSGNRITQQGTTTTVITPGGSKYVYDLPQGQSITVPGPR